MTLALIGAAAIVAAFALFWLIGAREPVYAISTGDPHWFIAIRGTGGALAPGMRENWSSRREFAFIGGEDAYWDRFIIAAGGDPSQMPITLDGVDDAYVGRVKLRRPARILFGVLKVLIASGVLTKPQGATIQDAQSLGFRADVMPGAGAISRLLAQPATYAPAMVNFLSYYADAQYRSGARNSGRAAYMRYGIVAMRTVYRTGGRLLFAGRVLSVLREATAGPSAGRWDDVAAMQYPSPAAILSMEHAPDYRAALDDRDAGLERTLVIATTPN